MRSRRAARSARLGVITLLLAGAAGILAATPAGAAGARSGLASPAASLTISGGLSGVAATSARNAWAVGWSGSLDSPDPLIARWNGTAWRQVPSLRPISGGLLNGVAATSARNAWAVGYTGFPKTVILRWNGTAWKKAPSPSGSLSAVAATSADSAWAVGYTGSGPSDRTLILRWNGTTWTRVPSPDPGPGAELGGVTALSGSDAWAVGIAGGKTLILRWNGQMWSGAVGQLSPAAAPASSLTPSAVSSPAVPPGRQAAQALAALLAQSGTDRAAVRQAVSAVADCSPGLSQDETIFSNAASSRQDLLGQLAALPDRSALPASMLQDLTTAWQASGQADQDLANWTHDEISHGCSTNDQSDASYQAAMVPDKQATTYKKAFAALWTAIADEYGLPLYHYNQI
jgi:hypothetical protein